MAYPRRSRKLIEDSSANPTRSKKTPAAPSPPLERGIAAEATKGMTDAEAVAFLERRCNLPRELAMLIDAWHLIPSKEQTAVLTYSGYLANFHRDRVAEREAKREAREARRPRKRSRSSA